MAEPASLFISYRRDDSSGHVGRLYDALAARFGPRQIFVDIDRIGPGEDFTKALDEAVTRSKVVLVVIGKRWVRDESGTSRLHATHDWVRVEVVAAMQRGLRVIPVLVQGAPMPSARDLPPELNEFTKRNAFELSDARWKEDVARLVKEIAPLLVPVTAPNPGKPLPKPVVYGIMGIAALVILFTIKTQVYPMIQARRAQSLVESMNSSGQPSSEIPTTPVGGDPPPIHDGLSAAIRDGTKWRADARLLMVNVNQNESTRKYSTQYMVGSPADLAELNITDEDGNRTYFPGHLNSAPGPAIPESVIDITQALASARALGMRGPLSRGILSWDTDGSGGTLVWTLQPVDTDGPRAFEINAVTGAPYRGR